MPGNDLTSIRDIIPTSSTRQDQARADITTILTGIINDIEPKVTPAGIDISSNLSFLSGGSYYAATSLGYASFQNRSTDTGVAVSMYVKSGELYFRDAATNNIQMTSGGALNSASLGGITGGAYGTGGVEVNWDGSDYNFYDGSGTFADVVMKEVVLSNDTNWVAIDVPLSGVTNYSMTLPAAVAGGATTILQSNASGNCSWSNTFSTDITMSGSAEIKHGDRTLTLAPAIAWGYDPDDGSSQIVLDADGEFIQSQTTGKKINFPIPLRVGDRIKSIRYVTDKSTSGTAGITLYKMDLTGSPPTGAAHESWSNSTSGVTDTTETLSSAYTIGANDVCWLMIDMVASSDEVYGVQVVYDRP